MAQEHFSQARSSGAEGTTTGATSEQVTRLLGSWSEGDESALDELIPLIQPELQRLARHYMRGERAGHTLQTTALINEAYLRLVDVSPPAWNNSKHFFAVAAQVMRRIMVDHARERQALKRGGGAVRVTLDEAALVTQTRADELLALDEALENLTAVEPRLAQIVELRYFGGLRHEEIAQLLNVSPTTVKRDWSAARAWLLAALSEEQDDER